MFILKIYFELIPNSSKLGVGEVQKSQMRNGGKIKFHQSF